MLLVKSEELYVVKRKNKKNDICADMIIMRNISEIYFLLIFSFSGFANMGPCIGFLESDAALSENLKLPEVKISGYLQPASNYNEYPKLAEINDASYQYQIWDSESIYEKSQLQYEVERLLEYGETRNYDHKIGVGLTGAKVIQIEMQAYGVFKPNEDSWGDVADASNEVLAYEVDKLFSFDLVPVTVFREHNGVKGSLQLFMKNSTMAKEYTDTVPTEKIGKLEVFDFLLGGFDRHKGNYIFDINGRLIAIDHGMRNKKGIASFNTNSFTSENGINFLKTEEGRKLVSRLKEISNREIFHNFAPYLKVEHIHALIKRKSILERLYNSL